MLNLQVHISMPKLNLQSNICAHPYFCVACLYMCASVDVFDVVLVQHIPILVMLAKVPLIALFSKRRDTSSRLGHIFQCKHVAAIALLVMYLCPCHVYISV